MGKGSGELVDHFLLHYMVVRDLWSLALNIFWSILGNFSTVVDMLVEKDW